MKYRFVPVEGKPYAFTVIEKATGQTVNISDELIQKFEAGEIKKR